MSDSSIQNQVKLPLAVALKVVLQGIKVRFGRSIVTVMGVALGIAFLMSILAGQVIKSGVGGEQALRNEASRMFNFFVAEAGLPKGLVLGVIEVGSLNDVEERLMVRIAEAEPQAIQKGDKAGKGATALLVIGEGRVTADTVSALVKDARHKLVFTTRKEQADLSGVEAKSIMLVRELRADELIKQRADARKARARNIWIVVVALFVTVIGITNSMLMSVTERFREIGTMKCLGALSGFVRQMFLIESSLIGCIGAFSGAIVGAVFSTLAYACTYGMGLVLESLNPVRMLAYFVTCVVVGIVLAVIAALYPARFASRMLPANALRSEI